MLNWGKNTQWAGRQLMVGFTVPLTMLGSIAAKSFMDIEEQIIKIRRVYGDFSTTVEDTDKIVSSIRTLASEFTKYGVAVQDTMSLAAEVAATGKMGADLVAQVTEATRLAVLGNVKQSEAMQTTMSITNAFGTATEELAAKIDFLNAVENQSVTSIEDLTIAIPKAGPVIRIPCSLQ
jgi:TP901 family phage tail tape measure protein